MNHKPFHRTFLTACCLWSLVGASTVLGQNLSLQSGYIDWSPEATTVTFSLTFNRTPDFRTDEFGRQADSFQFFIAPTPTLFAPYSSIIRGAEIHVANDLRIRNAEPRDLSDPDAHGWGSIRGVVPFTLNGQTLTFSAPLDVLNVSGSFGARVELYEYGIWRPPMYFGVAGGLITAPVPEPGTCALFALAALSGALWWRKRRASLATES